MSALISGSLYSQKLNMKLIAPLLALALLFGSCIEPYKFWNVTDFTLDHTSLADGSEVILAYSSSGPKKHHEEYYTHLIVINEQNGDTINVLSIHNPGFKETDMGQKFTFQSFTGEMGQLIYRQFKHLDENNREQIDLPEIKIVARDIKYDFIAQNNHPTVIGFLGKTKVE
ncbi:MAG: hypothetical protein KDC92_07320 [Bacteroidetes bacterium]|nr:hypothetical protein [Bacteroidota bacterium]